MYTRFNQKFNRLIITTCLFLMTFLFLANFVSASEFVYTGNVSYENGTYVPNVNVSLTIPSFVATGNSALNGSWSNFSDSSGNFRINVSLAAAFDINQLFFKLKIVLNASDGNATFVGPNLPDFPAFMYTGSMPGMPNLANQTFYLRKGVTVRIAAINVTGADQNFSYNIRDLNLGTEVDSSMVFPPVISSVDLYLELSRNYSINVFFNNAPPLSLSIRNLTELNYSGPRVNIGAANFNNHISSYFYNYTFNTSVTPKYVDGYIVNSSGNYVTEGSAVVNSSKFEIWVTNVEGGNFVCIEDLCLNNMSKFQNPADLASGGVVLNATSGFFNLSFPGTTPASNVLLVVLVNDSNGVWSLGVQNISTATGAAGQRRQNITLYPIAGSNFVSGTNLKSPQTFMRLLNSSGSAIASQGFFDVVLDYGLGFDLHMGMQTNTSGVATFPLVSNFGVKQIKAFVSQYPPRDTSFAASAMDGDISVTMYNLQAKSFDGSQSLGATMQMLVSNSTCDVMNPPSVCNIGGSSQDSAFNPLAAILRGSISVRMTLPGGMVLHYKNVDMLSSGPPDFISDSNATQTSTVTGKLSDVWRFGSRGPKIYDQVIIGLNYSAKPLDTGALVYIQFPLLYNSDGNVVWNVTANGSDYNAIKGNLSDYSGFNETFFNESNGRLCNVSGSLPENGCFYNGSQAYLWMSFPHFSNVGSSVSGITSGSVTLNLSTTIYCNSFCDFYFNVTNYNFTLSTYKINWTINFTANATAGNVNTGIFYYNISNTTLHLINNGTNVSYYNGYNFTYYNSSNPSHSIHQFWLNLTRSSNKTAQSILNFTFVSDIGSRYELSLQVNLTCVENWTYNAWSACSNSVQTRTPIADLANCGTTASQVLSQSCTSTNAGTSGGGETGSVATQLTNLWLGMDSGVSYTYDIGKSNFAIDAVTLTPNVALAQVKITVKQFDGLPSPLLQAPIGTVYKYSEIGREGILNSQIQDANVVFDVDKSWVDALGDKANIVLMRYENGVWDSLITSYLGESSDGARYKYKADVGGFSYFAITYQTSEQKVAQKEATASASGQINSDGTLEDATNTVVQDNLSGVNNSNKKTWWSVVLVLVVILIVGLLVYFVSKYKKDNNGYKYKTYKGR